MPSLEPESPSSMDDSYDGASSRSSFDSNFSADTPSDSNIDSSQSDSNSEGDNSSVLGKRKERTFSDEGSVCSADGVTN